MQRVCLVLLLSTVTGLGLLLAQMETVTFEHYNQSHGLSAPVTKIAQDSFGFLWLGTTDGLNRFDGKHFVVYRNIAGDSTSIVNNILNDISVDALGRVWAATNGGLCYYDYADDAFHEIQFDHGLEQIDRHRVHAVTISRDKGMWFATRTYVHRVIDGAVVRSVPLPGGDQLTIKYLFDDGQGRLWIGTNDVLFALETEKGTFRTKKITSPFTIERGLNVTIHPIIPYVKDTLLIGSWYGGVHKVTATHDGILPGHIPDLTESDQRKHVIRGMCRRRDGMFWVGSYGNGLSVLDAGTESFVQHYHADPANPRSLSSDYIYDVFLDQSNILWVGTAEGLDKYDPLTRQFMSVEVPSVSDEFSVYRLPRAIVEDRLDPEWLYIPVSGAGVFHYHTRTHRFEVLHHQQGSDGSLPDNGVLTMYYDRAGRTWLGMSSGLCHFDPVIGTFSRFILPGIERQNGIHQIIQDTTGRFWFASNTDGVFTYDADKHQASHYGYVSASGNGLPDNKVFCILADSDNHIWIGTQNRGLARLDQATGQFMLFEHDRSDPASIPDNGIYDLHQDPQGMIWVATENGLAKIDPASLAVQNYTSADGLANNIVFAIQPDMDGYLWLATFNGLSKFNPDTETFRNFYVYDGLPSNNMAGAMYCASDGTLYFGSSGMLTICRPESMVTNQRIPRVVITGGSIFDRPLTLRRDGELLRPIHLSYRDNMITFHFSALNYTNTPLNQYAYRLEGFDDQWIYCGQAQSATFTNLDGGAYTFRVKAANNDGIWNETGAQVMLIVHPPFWSTWWFYLLCAVVVAGILYGFYRIRINQIMKLQRIRMRISRDLHDDIGSTLSSINMVSSMAERALPQGKTTQDVFHTISNASGQAMDLMSDIVWSINPKNDRMEMIIIRMRQYASEILEAAGMQFSLGVDEACGTLTLDAERRKDFYLIFKEAVNNTAKYSEASFVSIRLNFQSRRLIMQVADNGIGFDPAATGDGNGIRNMKARAQQLHADLDIQSGIGAGTVITLSVPVVP